MRTRATEVGLLFLLVVIALMNLYLILALRPQIRIPVYDDDQGSQTGMSETIRERGTVREFEIPPETGQIAYVLVFDEPYLLMSSALGLPQYVSQLQIVESEMASVEIPMDFSEYVGNAVEVYGNLGWGFADSRTIEVVAITEL